MRGDLGSDAREDWGRMGPTLARQGADLGPMHQRRTTLAPRAGAAARPGACIGAGHAGPGTPFTTPCSLCTLAERVKSTMSPSCTGQAQSRRCFSPARLAGRGMGHRARRGSPGPARHAGHAPRLLGRARRAAWPQVSPLLSTPSPPTPHLGELLVLPELRGVKVLVALPLLLAVLILGLPLLLPGPATAEVGAC